MRSDQSDRSLKAYYRLINKRFFNGELPDNVVVRWARAGEEKDVACTEKLNPDNKNKYLILLNRAKNPTASIKLASLLHEAVHVATQYRDNHGEAFDDWHKKLTDRGAFKKGALLANITLF